MAIALVGSVLTSAVADGATSVSISSASLTAGNSLVVVVHWEGDNPGGNSVTLSSVTVNSGGQSATLIGSYSELAAMVRKPRSQMAYISNISSSGTYNITATFGSAATKSYIYAYEFSGGDTSAFYDSGTDNTNSVTSGTSPSLSITTGSANDAIVVSFISDTSDNPTLTGYTRTTGSTFNSSYHSSFYNVDVGTAAAKTLTFSTQGGNQMMRGAAFKVASSGSSAALSGSSVTGGSGSQSPAFSIEL